MVRKKVNLQWISNNATRRATYKRRYQSLVKKASELTTLCGTNMCVVVYADSKAQPDVSPSDEEAKKLLKKFKDMPNVDSLKKTQSQAEFLQRRTFKLHEETSKLDQENRERETLVLLHDSLDGHRPGLVGTTKDELLSLKEIVEMKMNKAKARIEQLVGGKEALPDPFQVMLPVSSSSQTQASSYTYNEMQIMVPLEEHQMQKDWPLASLLEANYGELGTALYDGFVGSSRDTSGSGFQMMEPVATVVHGTKFSNCAWPALVCFLLHFICYS
ncbi:hypothetical protein BDA96_05G195900 [Sorghum bicolor]|uniref:MADS-box domain-containing protein n=2 Tax=Sorghum bicolor TaxID=4558 RepID=A0A921UH03_SORBI|nr:hypothetical protein BDA96_05G195900 [Sorghum bicolor]